MSGKQFLSVSDILICPIVYNFFVQAVWKAIELLVHYYEKMFTESVYLFNMDDA